MYEQRHQPLISKRLYYRRLLGHFCFAVAIVAAAWGIGIIGYRFVGGLAWDDAMVNAAMILGGMGPIDKIDKFPGKLFASFYALFSGLIFVVLFCVLLAPVLYRLLHRFHLEKSQEK